MNGVAPEGHSAEGESGMIPRSSAVTNILMEFRKTYSWADTPWGYGIAIGIHPCPSTAAFTL
jgi:hypothetical protein